MAPCWLQWQFSSFCSDCVPVLACVFFLYLRSNRYISMRAIFCRREERFSLGALVRPCLAIRLDIHAGNPSCTRGAQARLVAAWRPSSDNGSCSAIRARTPNWVSFLIRAPQWNPAGTRRMAHTRPRHTLPHPASPLPAHLPERAILQGW